MTIVEQALAPFVAIAQTPWLLIWLITMMTLACVSDVRHMKIPNKLNALLLAGNLLLFVLAPLIQGDFKVAGLAVASAALGFTVLLIPAVATGFKMAGDIKFIGALGFALTPLSMIAFLLLAIVFNASTNGWLIYTKRKSFEAVIPFAPFFAASFILMQGVAWLI